MNNTVKRSLSGVVFLAVMISCLYLNEWLYGALLIFMMIAMLHEFFAMTMGDKYKLSRVLAILLGVCSFVSLFLVYRFSLDFKFVGINVILLLGIMISSLYVKDKTEFRRFAFIYTGLLYIAIPLSLSNLVVLRGGAFDGTLMLAFFCIIWASDVGAYCIGMLFGKNGRKLFPTVSPKKSWAGFWGGMLMAVVAAMILSLTGLFTFPWWHSIILAVIMHSLGVYGDLFESQWKRVCEVKDSGNIIPGHGGALDRFDSALFAIPAGVIYLVINGLI